MVALVKSHIVEVLVTTDSYTSVRQFVLPEDDFLYKKYRLWLLVHRDYDAIEVAYGNADLLLECAGQTRDPVAICYTSYDSGVQYQRELLRHEVEHCVRWHHANNIRFIIEWLPTPER